MKALNTVFLTIVFAYSGWAHAFTYQGELNQAGTPFDGSADIEFALFDALTDGTRIGSVDLHSSVAVSEGRFVVDLIQWTAEFDGRQLWLEISVSLPSGGSLTTLSPRQKLAPAPYAEFAYKVDTDQVQQRVTGTCPLGQYLRGINDDGSVQCEIVPGEPTATLVVDVINAGQYNSIAIGSDGLPVISYYDFNIGRLKVLHCENSACTASTQNFPNGLSGVGEFNDIAIGNDGLPVISYFSKNDGTLRISHCDDLVCSSSRDTELDFIPTVGKFTSIAIGTDGFPVISYYDESGGNLKVAHCNNLLCTSFGLKTALSTVPLGSSDVGSYSSITIAPGNGFPVISSYGGGALVLTRCQDLECSSTSNGKIDSADSVGAYSSIAIGVDGLPVISYFDQTNLALKVLHCNNVTCTSQTRTLVDNPDNASVGIWTSIVIGSDGFPVISYVDISNGKLKLAKCNNSACTSSIVRTIDGPGIANVTSIAIGNDGQPVISYQKTIDGLKFVKCGGNCL